VSARYRSRLIALPAIFLFAAAVAVVCSALTRIHTDFAWKMALFFSVLLFSLAPDLSLRAITWFGGLPATRLDAIAATVLSLAVVPAFAWVFRQSAHFISGVMPPDKYIGLLRLLSFMLVGINGIVTMRLTKRWS
jgi:hypothetical protein